MPARSLALCLDAPLQSWGVRSRGIYRDTGREPSKSGVVGLLGAALGVPRDDTERIARLAKLRMGIRVDREGNVERDYHTTQDVPTTTGTGHRTVVSHRYYLAGAVFLVVLADDDEAFLRTLLTAIQEPHWPLFLGRRAFVPARPLVGSGHADEQPSGLGLSDQPLETVLESHPFLTGPDAREPAEPIRLRVVVDCPPDHPAAEPRHDVPLSFGPAVRRFATRTVHVGQVELGGTQNPAEEIPCI